MKSQQTWWQVMCGLLTMLGVIVGLATSAPETVVIFVSVAMAGAVLTAAIAYSGDTKVPARAEWRRARSNALLSGSAAAALIGLASLLGAWVLLIVMLVAGTSPVAVRYYRNHRLPDPAETGRAGGWRESTVASAPEDETGPPKRAAVDPCSQSDADLCLIWRASFMTLQGASTLAKQLEVVGVRQACLDEFERRNPDGLTAWLASGARAAGDPSRFVVGGRRAGCDAGIDWDDLLSGTDK